MKPSILVFCPVLGAFGGTETHVVGIAAALSRNGWNVRVAVIRSCLNKQLRDKIVSSGARYSVWPSMAFLGALLVRSDLLYTNSQGNASPMLWRLKGRQQKGFHHVHTSADPVEQSYWRSGFKEFVRSAQKLVACSETTRRNLLDLGAQGEVTFLPYLTSFSGVERGLPAKGAIARPKRFAFVGRVEKPKGIDLIMEAARSSACHGIEWHIHGDGDYLEVVRAANLPSVVLHGRFSGAEALARIHEEADALVLPSFHSEGMPLALLEGMAKGLPWIATNKGGTAELAAGHQDLMVFEPGDVEGFIKLSQQLRDRLSEGEVDSRGIKDMFDSRFAGEVVTAKWLDYCNRCLAGEQTK